MRNIEEKFWGDTKAYVLKQNEALVLERGLRVTIAYNMDSSLMPIAF
jgi:hypothetical protein